MIYLKFLWKKKNLPYCWFSGSFFPKGPSLWNTSNQFLKCPLSRVQKPPIPRAFSHLNFQKRALEYDHFKKGFFSSNIKNIFWLVKITLKWGKIKRISWFSENMKIRRKESILKRIFVFWSKFCQFRSEINSFSGFKNKQNPQVLKISPFSVDRKLKQRGFTLKIIGRVFEIEAEKDGINFRQIILLFQRIHLPYQ